MDYHLENFPPILPRPGPTSVSQMAAIPATSCSTSSASSTSTELVSVSQVSINSSVVVSSGVTTVTRGSAAVPLSTVFSQVPIMVVNPMQHNKLNTDPTTLPSQTGQVESSLSSCAMGSNKQNTFQSREMPKNTLLISGDQNLGNFLTNTSSSGSLVSNSNVQVNQSLGNVVLASVVQNGVLLGKVLLNNMNQYPSVPGSISQVTAQQTNQIRAENKSAVISSGVATVTHGSAAVPLSTVFSQQASQSRAPLIFKPFSTTHCVSKDTMESNVDISASEKLKTRCLPVVKNCYSLTRLTLRQMLELLKEGQDILTCFEPGAEDFKRTLAFCEALAKYDVFVMHSTIQQEFYDSLIDRHFSMKEVMILRLALECSETYKYVDRIFAMAEKSDVSEDKETEKSVLDQISFPDTKKFPTAIHIRLVLKDFLQKNKDLSERTKLEAEMIIQAFIVAKLTMNLNIPKARCPLNISKTKCPSEETGTSDSSERVNTKFSRKETNPVYLNISHETDTPSSNKKTGCTSFREKTDADSIVYSDLHEVLTSSFDNVEILDESNKTDGKNLEIGEPSSFCLPKWKWIMLADIEKYYYDQGDEILTYCYLCGFKFDNVTAVWEHIRTLHAKLPIVPRVSSVMADNSYFPCTHCNRKYPTLTEVRRHELDVHLSDYPCFFCGLSCNDRFEMIQHIVNVHGKLYKCNKCQTHFFDTLELKKHKLDEHQKMYDTDVTMEESKNPIIICFFCNTSLRKQHDLLSHINDNHIDTLSQLSSGTKCSSCRHSFLDKNALLFHNNFFARSQEFKRPLSTTSLKKLCTECIMKGKVSNTRKDEENGKTSSENVSEINVSEFKKVGECTSSMADDKHLEYRQLIFGNVRYGYPLKKLFEYCRFGKSFPKELITCIMDELIKLMLTDLSHLRVDSTSDLQDVLIALSRTHKFNEILQKYKLKPLPWNDKIQAGIKIFLRKAKTGYYKLKDTYNLSIVYISLQKGLGYFEQKRCAVLNKPVRKKYTRNCQENGKVQSPSTSLKQKPVAIAPKGCSLITLNDKEYLLSLQKPPKMGDKLQSESQTSNNTSESIKGKLKQKVYEMEEERIANKELVSEEKNVPFEGEKSIAKSLRERKSSVKYTFDHITDESEEEEAVSSSSETDDEWTPPRESSGSELSEEEASDMGENGDHSDEETSGLSNDETIGCHSKEVTKDVFKGGSDMLSYEYTLSHADNDASMINDDSTENCIENKDTCSEITKMSSDSSLTNISSGQKRLGQKPEQDSIPFKMLKIVSSPDRLPSCLRNMLIQNKSIKCSFVKIERGDKADELSLKASEVSHDSAGKIRMGSGDLPQKRGRGRQTKHFSDRKTNTEENKGSISSGVKGWSNRNVITLTETHTDEKILLKETGNQEEEKNNLQAGELEAGKRIPKNSNDTEIEDCVSIVASEESHALVEREFITCGKIQQSSGRGSSEKPTSANENDDRENLDSGNSQDTLEKCDTSNEIEERSSNNNVNTYANALVKNTSNRPSSYFPDANKGLQRKRKRSGEKSEMEQINEDMDVELSGDIMLRPKMKRRHMEKDLLSDSENVDNVLSDNESDELQNEKVANNDGKHNNPSTGYETEMTYTIEPISNINDDEDAYCSERSDDNSNDSCQSDDFVQKETKRMLSKIVNQSVSQTNTERLDQTIEHAIVQKRTSSTEGIITVGKDPSGKQAQVVESVLSFRIKEEKNDPEYLKASYACHNETSLTLDKRPSAYKPIENSDKADIFSLKASEVSHDSTEKIRIESGDLPQKRGRGRPRKIADSKTSAEENKESVSSGMPCLFDNSEQRNMGANTQPLKMKEEKEDPEYSKATSVSNKETSLAFDKTTSANKPDQSVVQHPLPSNGKQKNTRSKTLKNNKNETHELKSKPSSSCLRLVPICGTNKFLIVSLSTDEFGNVLHNGLPIQNTSMQQSLMMQQPQLILQPQSQPMMTQQTPILQQQQTPIMQQQQQTPIIQRQQTPIIQQLQTPIIQHQQTPILQQQQTPIIQQQTPIMQQQTQVMQQNSSIIQQQTPIIQQQQTPIMQPQQTPIMQQQPTQILQHQTQIIQQQHTPLIQQQKTPIIQEQTPIMQQQQTPIIQQQHTQTIQPQTPILQQQTPIMHQQTQIIQHQQAPVIQQPTQMIQPTPIIQQSRSVVHQPSSVMQSTQVVQPTPMIQPTQMIQQPQMIQPTLEIKHEPVTHPTSKNNATPTSLWKKEASNAKQCKLQETNALSKFQGELESVTIKQEIVVDNESDNDNQKNEIVNKNQDSGIHVSPQIPQNPLMSTSNQVTFSVGQPCVQNQDLLFSQSQNLQPSHFQGQENHTGLNLSQYQNFSQASQIIQGQMQVANIGQIQQTIPVLGSQGSVQTLVVNQQMPLSAGQLIYVPDSSTSQTGTSIVSHNSQAMNSSVSGTFVNNQQHENISKEKQILNPKTIAALSESILKRNKTLLPKPVDNDESASVPEQTLSTSVYTSIKKRLTQKLLNYMTKGEGESSSKEECDTESVQGFHLVSSNEAGKSTKQHEFATREEISSDEDTDKESQKEGRIKEVQKDLMLSDENVKEDSCIADPSDHQGRQRRGRRKKTVLETKWAFNVFKAWHEASEEKIPDLVDMNYQQLNHWLSKFVLEIRKRNGQPYPSKTIYIILYGLLRHLKNNGIFHYNFLDERDPRFAELHVVLERRMKQLKDEGVDVETRSVDLILPADEDKLWDLGVFGKTDAETLQMTIFYHICKFFGVRGNDHHWLLEHKQFTVGKDKRGKWVQFVEKSSDNTKATRSSTMSDMMKKGIRHYFPDGPRCIADLFELYLREVGDGPFYKKPLEGPSIRYSEKPLTLTKIKLLMKIISCKGGLPGYYTNRSVVSENPDDQEIIVKQET